MGSFRLYAALLLTGLCGCSGPLNERNMTYMQGYQSQVQRRTGELAGQFQGGVLPYYHWVNPMVQQVYVPGRIINGVYVPAHQELVIIKPGEWQLRPAAPDHLQQENSQHAPNSLDMDVADITHLPNGQGPEPDVTSGKSEGHQAGMAE